jgi:DNA modification methylase
VTAVILRGDAACLPLPDASVDLIVTSPPYFAMRSYSDGGEHYAGQIGSEETPREYVAALTGCTREWMRVLKPEGSIFVNLGDKYNNQGGRNGHTALPGVGRFAGNQPVRRIDAGTTGQKSLLGIPWRYALGCIDDLGLILRAEIIWDKPNGLPESVTDRVRRSHEQVFHFTKLPRYFAAVDEIRLAGTGRGTATWSQRKAGGEPSRQGEQRITFPNGMAPNALGTLPGSVWEIASQPLTVPERLGVDHFAAFPMELPRRIILGWSPSGICTECGEGRQPVRSSVKVTSRPGYRVGRRGDPVMDHRGNQDIEGRAGDYDIRITGYACACPQPGASTRPAVVVDPFGGTGTTALVADMLGRTGVTVDRSADYCRIAQWRCADPGERARALGVPKPPPVIDGQRSLFDGLD